MKKLIKKRYRDSDNICFRTLEERQKFLASTGFYVDNDGKEEFYSSSILRAFAHEAFQPEKSKGKYYWVSRYKI